MDFKNLLNQVPLSNLIGVDITKCDEDVVVEKMLNKLCTYEVFDNNGEMNWEEAKEFEEIYVVLLDVCEERNEFIIPSKQARFHRGIELYLKEL